MYWNRINEIDASELVRWLQDSESNLRIIDVRQPGEIAAGTVPGAEPMPLQTLPLRMDELDRKQKLVFICRTGARSAQACMFLQQQGYENVLNLRGGVTAWAQTGQPFALPQAV